MTNKNDVVKAGCFQAGNYSWQSKWDQSRQCYVWTTGHLSIDSSIQERQGRLTRVYRAWFGQSPIRGEFASLRTAMTAAALMPMEIAA